MKSKVTSKPMIEVKKSFGGIVPSGTVIEERVSEVSSD